MESSQKTGFRQAADSKRNVEAEVFEIKPLKETRKDFEIDYIQKVLDECSGNITEAAKLMEISRRQLFNKITEYRLK